jgi:SH3-like domain-containing protein
MATLTLYRTPGVGRIDEFATGKLPGLEAILGAGDGETPLAVAGKKGGWLRIVYDDAGHEGWLPLARTWIYTPWEAYLPGRSVRLLPGLRKEYTFMRNGPAADALALGTVGPQQRLRVSRVEGDWAFVTADGGSGWLRWRDEDGRFLTASDNGISAQNR